jgi:2-succinyl-5-enolpyruvyl-6-hydroxy-3-cyclohexene-1-carboxylate synthase
MIGDLAFLHDLSALELAHQSPATGAICVIQNQGGAIFDFLAGQDLPHFASAIRNPRPLSIARLAAAFGLPYHHVATREALAAALATARVGDALHLIEIDVPPQSARDGLRMLFLSTQFQ